VPSHSFKLHELLVVLLLLALFSGLSWCRSSRLLWDTLLLWRWCEPFTADRDGHRC
jgi:hypothetical protein